VPGFGGGAFGSGGFGEWTWSLVTMVDGIPSVYREQDELIGNGTLRALLEGLAPSMDGLRRKIRDYDQLRNPLIAPTDKTFSLAETILKTENLGDGTSRVFMSVGVDGDRFDGLRNGMTLIDFRGFRFVICKISKSSLASEFTDPPTDPVTLAPTGKHIIVQNIGQSSTEFIPFASGTYAFEENPSVTPSIGTIVAVASASLIDGETFTLDDGVNPALIFEFDKVPDGAGANIAVDISLATSGITVADAMVTAINAATPLNLVASNLSGGSATVTITNPATGVEGDVAWSDTVADAGFIVTSPTGGGPGAFIFESPSTLSDNGSRLPPYAFNVEGSYVGGLNIANNRVTVSWKESGVDKSGSFTNEGRPGGDLADTSIIDLSVGAVATGQIRIYNDTGAAIDADSIRVTYTQEDDPPSEDAEINSQNILSFLASDVGIKLDRNDPEFLQRSYVNSAHKIWDVKGTELGYSVLGRYAGYFVSASPLYNIIESISLGLPSSTIFSFPSGTTASGGILSIPYSNLIDGETFTLDDGINPIVVFEFDKVPNGVSGANIAVDISGATTAIDVATIMVASINGAASLFLSASNGGGLLDFITVNNTVAGTSGNVLTWSETVSNAGFIVTQPSGGTSGTIFTTVDPRRPRFDEVAMDAIPMDLLCSDVLFPSTAQAVTVLSATQTADEGSNKRVTVIVSAADMSISFGTEGSFVDLSAATFVIENFQRIDSSTYSFETASFVVPSLGAGVVTWKTLKFIAPNTVTIAGIGTDVEDLGRQTLGYTGRRYRITKTFTDPVLGDYGNWAFIDNDGVVSYLESFENTTGTTYQFVIIATDPPAVGAANIFLKCEIVTDCNFCRASSILVRISPDTILDYPEALEGDALSRLIIRLEQMIPGHVRIAAFVYDPGPALASWAMSASSSSSEYAADDALYTAYFDEDEFPADLIPVDSAPIIATSEVTITNENVLEEYLAGADPLIAGTWTASGLWHITEYRSSTQFKSFNYGQNDVGRLGDGGAVAPDYDGVAIATVSRLISPAFGLLATDTAVVIRFRHYGDMRSGLVNDLVRVEVFKGAGLFYTIGKASLGLDGTGTNGSITTYSEDIQAMVVADDNYHLEFVFDTAGAASGAGTGEGWYVDDIEVQVTPV